MGQLTWKTDDKPAWYPSTISALDAYLGTLIIAGTPFPDEKVTPLKKNLAYNLQYIQFLDRVIKDIKLSSVLLTQNIKSFSVHSAAVIEGVFNYIVISQGYGTTTEWKSYKKLKNDRYEINGTVLLHETEVSIKITPPVLTEMTFDQMSKKVESKKLLGNVGDLYAAISRIRKLRNKIHIHGFESSTDTDYHSFSKSEYDLARRVLYGVLTSPLFEKSPYPKIFEYLKEND